MLNQNILQVYIHVQSKLHDLYNRNLFSYFEKLAPNYFNSQLAMCAQLPVTKI